LEKAIHTPLFISVDQDLSIGVGTEAMTTGQHLCPEFEVVIDLAVEDDPYGVILVRHRLMAGWGEVDDGKTAEAQDHVGVLVEAAVIRSTMGLHLDGPPDCGHVGRVNPSLRPK